MEESNSSLWCCGFYFPDYFLVCFIYHSVVDLFCFNYIMEKVWRWGGEVKRSENSLDMDGRKLRFYLNDICEREDDTW